MSYLPAAARNTPRIAFSVHQSSSRVQCFLHYGRPYSSQDDSIKVSQARCQRSTIATPIFLTVPPLALCNISQKLQDAFKDPSSPFHLPPGTPGPSDAPHIPDPSSSSSSTPGPPSSHQSAYLYASQNGYSIPKADGQAKGKGKGDDSPGVIEWPVAWGEMDMFRHINNVAYGRYFEVSSTCVSRPFTVEEEITLFEQRCVWRSVMDR